MSTMYLLILDVVHVKFVLYIAQCISKNDAKKNATKLRFKYVFNINNFGSFCVIRRLFFHLFSFSILFLNILISYFLPFSLFCSHYTQFVSGCFRYLPIFCHIFLKFNFFLLHIIFDRKQIVTPNVSLSLTVENKTTGPALAMSVGVAYMRLH